MTSKQYYKPYKRNNKGIWSVQSTNDSFYCCDENDKKIIKCTLSKTNKCIRVELIHSKARRYFTDFTKASKHLTHDQDIKTTKLIITKFNQW